MWRDFKWAIGSLGKLSGDTDHVEMADTYRHTINLVTGRPEDAAYALYSTVKEIKAAILPHEIDFQSGAVLPFALEGAVCALSLKEPGVAMPGVATPALALPFPSLDEVEDIGKTLVIYGGSSSIGSMTTQLARAAGINIISIVGTTNIDLAKQAGANIVVDRHEGDIVSRVTQAVKLVGGEFIGIFDAIGDETTFANDVAILEKLGGGHLACTHPPPAVPEKVKAGMIFAVNDIADSVWKDFVTPALQSGKLKCLPPPLVVGNGLGAIQRGLEMSKTGVSGAKLVVSLE